VASQENENVVTVHNAGINIVREKGTKSNSAPDHLMRLFSYNDILRAINKGYLTENYLNDTLLAKAQQAYIVSPVSSLVVLETKADYERFDIKDNSNSLKNASMKSAGAVPEPHEWLLIILVVSVMSCLIFKKYISKIYAS
jgi:XrtN system VIT domain protein